ncbi:hypothetical protein [Schaalia hyovaginalis]|uniref:Bacteriocin biosynthesis cyclodehydratase domain-containing protein n=1 Tax=Schaalia hyovaginalis TaxID=29316 RepID=A0A923E5F2_9ACTO|nr:hypothetical protein [Schaalia hyovaginalis]MBB6335147.1 bacteriocin biosynthesis cyclodehydratase domain-containing protein [Schaalia hyovaginalis]
MGTQLRKGTTATRRGPGALHLNAGLSRATTLHGLDGLEAGALIRALRSSSPRGTGAPALLRPDIAARLLADDMLETERPRLGIAIQGADLLSLALIGVLSETFSLHVDPRSPRTVPAPLHLALGSAALGMKLPIALAKAVAGTGITVSSLSSPDLVICAGGGHGDPAPLASLLVQDQPHLPIRACADGYELGPLTVPGRTACAHCVALRRAESDPFHPAEVYATRDGGPPEPPLVSLYAAAVHAAGMIRAFALGERALASCGRIVRIDALGRPHPLEVAPHPQCGCGAAGPPFPADDAGSRRGAGAVPEGMKRKRAPGVGRGEPEDGGAGMRRRG